VRIETKLNDVYLNLPESLLETRSLKASAGAVDVDQIPGEVEKSNETMSSPAESAKILGGHAYPSAPGKH
jgi:hypothetical protein